MRTLIVMATVLAAAAAQGQVCTFGPGALPVDTLPPGTPHGSQIPINHIVVLMQENRSYDHYFARLPGPADGASRQTTNPDPLGGGPIRAFHQPLYCEVADLDHSWSGTHLEWNGGLMDGFTAQNADPADPTGSRAMGFYRRKDLPYYYKLYRAFAIGDRYFSSVLTQTFPNREYLLAGTSAGHIRNDFPGPSEFPEQIFSRLDDAGISWKVYYQQFTYAGLFFSYVLNNDLAKLRPIAEFFTDAAAGTLPQVVFVDQIALGAKNVENDEHPPANIQVGEAFVAGVVNALFASPQWTSTALFLTYDEHGGYFDHVPPPPACPPDGIPPNLQPGDVPGAFDRYGIRVPVVVVSPFARRHLVSHVVHDHTSILRFIETRFDLPALTVRDANADPMLEFFDFAHPPYFTPPRMPAAPVSAEHVNGECA